MTREEMGSLMNVVCIYEALCLCLGRGHIVFTPEQIQSPTATLFLQQKPPGKRVNKACPRTGGERPAQARAQPACSTVNVHYAVPLSLDPLTISRTSLQLWAVWVCSTNLCCLPAHLCLSLGSQCLNIHISTQVSRASTYLQQTNHLPYPHSFLRAPQFCQLYR